MAIIYRTTGAWGAGKGSNLTAAEVDANFYDIAERMLALEEDPPEANSIANIVVVGATFKVILDDATELGPFNLPVATFGWRGEGWTNDNTYMAFDVFAVTDQGLYLVLREHETPETGDFDPDATESGNPLYHQIFGFPDVSVVQNTVDTYPALEHMAFGGI